MYISMLFVYYLLARSEERECLEKFGDSYRRYYENTGRILPRISRNRIHGPTENLPRKGVKRVGALVAIYLVTLLCTIALGRSVRSYSLSTISSGVWKNAAVISTTAMSESQMTEIVTLAVSDPDVKHRLGQLVEPASTCQLIYIVPLEWKIPELAMESEQTGQRHQGYNPTTHMNPTDFDPNRYKVLFSNAEVNDGLKGKDIIAKARYQKPLLLVKLNLQTHRVTAIKTPPAQGKYANIPVPIF
jgi:hypothetical protein